MIFVQIAAGAAGVGNLGNLAVLIAQGSLAAYSRDHEREADFYGHKFLVENGYDPRDASIVWKQLIRELEADEDRGASSLFFATHPSPEEGSETLEKLALKALENHPPIETGRDRFLKIMLPRRVQFLQDEMNRRNFDGTEELLKILIDDGENIAELRFFQGEVHRLRNKKGDQEKALSFYKKILYEAGAPPPELHRSLGQTYLKLNDDEKARAAFNKYLELVPDASDRNMIRYMIGKMS